MSKDTKAAHIICNLQDAEVMVVESLDAVVVSVSVSVLLEVDSSVLDDAALLVRLTEAEELVRAPVPTYSNCTL